ncbi:MAG TPA: 6-phosphogluconolactonase [Halomicronema sp.]
MQKKLEILPNLETLIQRALEIVVEKIESSIEKHNRFTIALAGGSTPKPLYEAISQQNLPWEKIHVFWGDERYVAPEHPESNQRMARLAWLNKVPIPAENIHPMPTNSNDPTTDAAKHEAELQEFFAVPASEVPKFDLILLGIGDDAHTASLFPHTPALSVRDRLVTVGSKDGQPRITFSVPLINQADCVMFLVAGAGKISALQQIFADTADSQTYPARLIQPSGELWWLLDASAGQKLK